MGDRQRGGRRGKDAIRADMQRRRRFRRVAIALVLLVGAGLVTLKVLGDRPDPPSPNVAEPFADGPATLLFADFTPGESAKVLRFDIEEETEEEVATMPRSSSTTGSLTSKWLSIVELAEDGETSVPVLYLFDPEAEEETEVGPGLAPTWKTDGTAVAYAEPLELERCSVVDCPGDKRIVVLDPATGDAETLIEGPYQILFWAGERLLVFDTREPEETISLTTDGSRAELDLRSSQIWGASPDGRWLVSLEEEGTKFIGLSDEGQVDEEIEVDIPPGTMLGAGHWAFDSSAVAAVLEDVEEPRVVLFSPSDPNPETVAEGVGSITRVLWAPTNDALFLTTVREGIGGTYCTIEGDCSELDFEGDARLPLRLE